MSRRFDTAVAPGGYAWWYLDALSDDGRHGLTIIAFVGSVFSPYYALARRRGGVADPTNHCALNVALYSARGVGGARWTMTERGARNIERIAEAFRIGPSQLRWEGDSLVIRIDEVAVPWPARVRGTVRVHPSAFAQGRHALDAAGRHHWAPIAPRARVEVALDRPGLRWQGPGYLDSNAGARPLEADFDRWDWSRAALAGGRSAVLYDVTRQDGSTLALALQYDRQGRHQPFVPPPLARLPASRWRVARTTRSEGATAPEVVQSLEDAPFYARSVLSSRLCGEPVLSVHESLSMRRWCLPVVQTMLPFRMPRRA